MTLFLRCDILTSGGLLESGNFKLCYPISVISRLRYEVEQKMHLCQLTERRIFSSYLGVESDEWTQLLFFCLLYPRTWTKRVGNLDYKSINFSAKVRYNHVTETDRAREGTETGTDEP